MNPSAFIFRGETIREAHDADVPELRVLVNSAYQELADMGLNYTATYQDERITRARISKGRAFVLERQGQIIGTVLLSKENLFTGKNSAYVSQLAVTPTGKTRPTSLGFSRNR